MTHLISEIITKTDYELSASPCTTIDDLKNHLGIVHDLNDYSLNTALNAAFSYSEKFMARKLQRHLIQAELLVPKEGGVYFMKYGNTELQYITTENGVRLENLKDFIQVGHKITFRASKTSQKVVIQYNCGFSTQRGVNQVPSDIIIGILMYAGALYQTKTDLTSESLKRSAICSENLFSPYRLRPRA